MILLCFMIHISNQNRFAVGLDVLVIIIGIFFELQVPAWNKARFERAEKQWYLARIERELTKSILKRMNMNVFM